MTPQTTDMDGMRRLYAAIRNNRTFTVETLAHELDVSERLVRALVQTLVSEGVIQQMKIPRGATNCDGCKGGVCSTRPPTSEINSTKPEITFELVQQQDAD